MTIKPLSLLLVSLAALLSACTKDSKPTTTPAESTQEAQPSTSAPAAQGAVLDGETYELFYPTAKGAPIKVSPKPGFKVNQDFPHRLKVKESEVTGAIGDKELTFALEGQRCEGTCEASADFSICNDQMCKLYRDVKLSWSAP